MRNSFALLAGLAMFFSACAPASPKAIPTSAPSEAIQPTLTFSPEPFSSPEATAFSAQVDEDRNGCIITAPPLALEADEFYTQYCDAAGIPIVASAEVSEKAVRQGYYLVLNFFAPIPEFRASMIAKGARLAIYGSNQTVRDVPETYTFSLSQMPNVAGLGGTITQPVTVTHESDLDGRWRPCGTVTVHELGHALRDIVLLSEVRGFLSEANGTFAQAVTQGLWEGSYASTNADEYFAEGISAYFGVYTDPNGARPGMDRDDLREYDPALFSQIEGLFNGFAWTVTCP